MARKKRDLFKPDEIIFGNTTRADLDELCYAFLSVCVHNNITIPACYRHGNDGGVYSEGFADFEKRKFGIIDETEQEMEGYNTDD